MHHLSGYHLTSSNIHTSVQGGLYKLSFLTITLLIPKANAADSHVSEGDRSALLTSHVAMVTLTS